MVDQEMFDTPPKTLKLLAALVWCSGAVVLYIKGSSMLFEAEGINPGQPWIWFAVLGGLLVGVVKAKYAFSRICLKNLKRIDALKQPKFWDFYRMRFFVFLLSMMILGTFLSRFAHGDYPILIAVALVDLSVATALLGSSNCFWKQKA